jgi:hypothetical protein
LSRKVTKLFPLTDRCVLSTTICVGYQFEGKLSYSLENLLYCMCARTSVASHHYTNILS